MKFSIRLLYLYLFSFIGLLVVVLGSIRMVDLGMKVVIFRGADDYRTYSAPVPEKMPGEPLMSQKAWDKEQKTEMTRQRQREFSGALAMILVGLPLYLYHWKQIQKKKE